MKMVQLIRYVIIFVKWFCIICIGVQEIFVNSYRIAYNLYVIIKDIKNLMGLT